LQQELRAAHPARLRFVGRHLRPVLGRAPHGHPLDVELRTPEPTRALSTQRGRLIPNSDRRGATSTASLQQDPPFE
jgi:hypothetical protein